MGLGIGSSGCLSRLHQKLAMWHHLLLCPRFLLLLLPSRSTLFPDLSPCRSNVLYFVFFLISQSAFHRLESLPACCHQYLDQTPTPTQASPPSSLFPSISPFPSQSCCRLTSPPDTARGQNLSLLYFWSIAMGFAAGGALGGTGDSDAEGRAGTGWGGRSAAGRV